MIAAALALGIALTGCGSSTGAQKTTTVVQTFTSSNGTGTGTTVTQTSTSSNGTGTGTTAASVTVAAPSTTASSTIKTGTTMSTVKSTAKPTAKSTAPTTAPKTTPAATGGPVNKVNPLTVNCTALLTANDVKSVTGTTIPSATSRVKDVANPKVQSTGSIRCLYGVAGGKQKVSARLTQYKTAAAAAAQIAVTAQSELSLGAQQSSTTVGGQPAKVLLRDGALIDVQYGDWTLGVAVASGVITKDQAGEVTELASRVLARVLKNAS